MNIIIKMTIIMMNEALMMRIISRLMNVIFKIKIETMATIVVTATKTTRIGMLYVGSARGTLCSSELLPNTFFIPSVPILVTPLLALTDPTPSLQITGEVPVAALAAFYTSTALTVRFLLSVRDLRFHYTWKIKGYRSQSGLCLTRRLFSLHLSLPLNLLKPYTENRLTR